jgi:hypothetical protein
MGPYLAARLPERLWDPYPPGGGWGGDLVVVGKTVRVHQEPSADSGVVETLDEYDVIERASSDDERPAPVVGLWAM